MLVSNAGLAYLDAISQYIYKYLTVFVVLSPCQCRTNVGIKVNL